MEKEVKSIGDYINAISELNESLVCDGMSKNEKMLFRGQSNIIYDLIPSIGRNRHSAIDISILDEERNMIEMAKYRMPNIFSKDLDPIELLALLQHYGIPTRLLDVTESALVALFFACYDDKNMDEDGEVVVFKENRLDIANYPMVNAIAESYKFARSTFNDLKQFYQIVIKQPYFIEQEVSYMGAEEGAKWVKECCDGLIYTYASNRSVRQMVQRGRYILFANKIIHNELEYENQKIESYIFKKIIEPIDKNREEIIGRIIIKKEEKQRIINELKIMGITKDYLFCDNTDIVCEGIRQMWEERVDGV